MQKYIKIYYSFVTGLTNNYKIILILIIENQNDFKKIMELLLFM